MAAVDDFQTTIENLAANTKRAVTQIYLAIGDELSREDAALQIAGVINRARAEAVALADVYTVNQIEELTGQPTTAVGVLPVDDSERLLTAVNTVLFDAPPTPQTMTVDELATIVQGMDLDPADYYLDRVVKKISRYIRDDNPEYLDKGTLAEWLDENSRPGSPEIDSDEYDADELVREFPTGDGSISRLERLAQNEPLQAAQKAAGEALAKQKPPQGYLGWVRQLNATACQLCRFWNRDDRVWPQSYKMARHTNCACVQKIVVSETRPKPVRSKRSKKR